MMEGISNNVLAVLLIVAIVVSLAGIAANIQLGLAPPLTGAATGVANLTISGVASITMKEDVVNFGSGSSGVTISSMDATQDGGFNDGNSSVGPCRGLVVENNGNVNVKINMSANKTATTFIGGTGAGFNHQSMDNETGSCTSGLVGDWTAMGAANSNHTVCDTLQFDDANDELRINFQLVIPTDAPQGYKVTQLNITGTQA